MELVGHGAQALGEQAQAGHLDRQLAGLGFHQRALGAEDVAQVPVLEGGVQVLAQRVARSRKLNAASEPSWSVAKLALPITRLSIMRPATLTCICIQRLAFGFGALLCLQALARWAG